MDSVSVIILIIGVLLVFVGLIGLILPILPGPALIFAGLVLAAWAEDFAHVGSMTIAILAVLAILAHAIDFIAGAFGAKKFGASRWASFGALIGVVVGVFFGFIGVLIGPFIGAFLGEFMAKYHIHSATRAGIGSWLGVILGTAAKVTLGFVMIVIFIVARYF
ncbi:MAG: DUF456 domain-containing protein [Deltaproteobacteria bacterium]|nr:MAG: DUF456 domain-containing protein [Deltaproteobacteria bacterium]